VHIAGTAVHLSRLEFELLVKFASDPVRVFSRDELARCIWRCPISGRTVESHVARLRTRLTSAGAHDVLVNTWGPRLVADPPALTPITRQLKR
jgi:DNA-binding response OmpR family regulator